jgi:hypothetical protein
MRQNPSFSRFVKLLWLKVKRRAETGVPACLSGNWLAWSRLRQKSGHFLPDEADFCRPKQRYGQKNLRSMAENGPF